MTSTRPFSAIKLVVGQDTLLIQTASRDDMIQQLLRWLENPDTSARSIGYINPHVFNLSADDPTVRRFLSNCDLVCIDGIGVSLALRCMFGVRVHRVVAEEMFNAYLQTPSAIGKALLVGVEETEVHKAMVTLNKLNTGMTIEAAIDGFRNNEEYARFFLEHNDADLILIGAGTPKSENIARIALSQGGKSICWHIGAGTIKTWAGTKKRAPALISKVGLQWLHRILFEPHTRARYLSGGFLFFKLLCTTKLQGINQSTEEWSETQ